MFAPHLPWRDDPVRSPAAAALGSDGGDGQRRELRGACRGGVRRGAWCVDRDRGHARAPASAAPSSSTGRCHRGWNGMAGEFGHMQVVPDGHPCECGRRGCWEQYCSGNALVRVGPSAARPPADAAAGAVRRRPGRADRPDGDAGRRGRRPGLSAGVRVRRASGWASAWRTWWRRSTPRSRGRRRWCLRGGRATARARPRGSRPLAGRGLAPRRAAAGRRALRPGGGARGGCGAGRGTAASVRLRLQHGVRARNAVSGAHETGKGARPVTAERCPREPPRERRFPCRTRPP